jgi:hypothetical protein
VPVTGEDPGCYRTSDIEMAFAVVAAVEAVITDTEIRARSIDAMLVCE